MDIINKIDNVLEVKELPNLDLNQNLINNTLQYI